MTHRTTRFCLFATLTAIAVQPLAATPNQPVLRAAPTSSDPVPAGAATDALRQWLESTDAEAHFGHTQARDPAHLDDELRRFYRQRDHAAAWTGSRLARTRFATLLAHLYDAVHHGLSPTAYGVEALAGHHRRLARASGRSLAQPLPIDRLQAEVAATASALLYLDHLAHGRFEPKVTGSLWALDVAPLDLAEELAHALSDIDLRRGLDHLQPQHAAYGALRDLLGRYRALAIAGGWPEVPRGPVLEAGDEADPQRITALVDRLTIEHRATRQPAGEPLSGSLEAVRRNAGEALAAGAMVPFDPRLATALRSFQARHGLRVDGTLGPETEASLDVTARHRVAQIAANLDRWRWLGRRLPADRLQINIAAYHLTAWRRGDQRLEMSVVVGRPTWKTPIFYGAISYLEVNPYWNVPSSIAAEEILPRLAADPSYLERQNMDVFDGWNGGTLDASTIDWSGADASAFRFRQRPGPNNALGRVKFMFPNPFDVYLHDTPAQGAFSSHERALSHGCIRVADPIALLRFVLEGSEEWTAEAVRKAIDSGENQRIDVATPMPVFLLYWTAFAEADGRAHFRADIYEQDTALIAALGDSLWAPRPTHLVRGHLTNEP